MDPIQSLRLVLLISLCCSAPAQEQQHLTADQIMGRLAENQATGQTLRARFVYDQTIHVVDRYGQGKVIREETATYNLTPENDKTKRTLVHYSGRYWSKGQYHPITGEPVDDPEGFDAGLVASFRRDLTQEDTKDGLAKGLFPLTAKEQKNMAFHLEGERIVKGRPAYVVRFEPKNKQDYGWEGEVLVDKEEFEPVTVYTSMNRKLPLWVRTMLGTDVPGLGFETQYVRVERGVWFPATFGAEFSGHAAFLFRRRFSISMENNNFKKTSTESNVTFGSAADEH